MRFITGVPSTREQSWSRMLRVAGMWHHMGFGFLAIVEKESGRFIGEAGFRRPAARWNPRSRGRMEVGWALMPSAHGRGFATEALTVLIGLSGNAFPRKTDELHHQPESQARCGSQPSSVSARQRVRSTTARSFSFRVREFHQAGNIARAIAGC